MGHRRVIQAALSCIPGASLTSDAPIINITTESTLRIEFDRGRRNASERSFSDVEQAIPESAASAAATAATAAATGVSGRARLEPRLARDYWLWAQWALAGGAKLDCRLTHNELTKITKLQVSPSLCEVI